VVRTAPSFMSTGVIQELNLGSRWQRWEPHVHAPGTTIFNDQFAGRNAVG